MNFSSINIQGSIISSEILTKIVHDDLRYQKPADFNLDRNIAIRDEIGIAWSAAQAHWKAFNLRRDRLKENDLGTSETRNSWIIPFLRELGYELETGKAEIINEKSYAISHRAANRDLFPVHIVGVKQDLDKRPEHGTRISPHALLQEYLNNCEHLYGITTNGKFLRLLRDATRLSKLSFLEFNLEQIMDEELYAEFALLFRVLHVSRMPQTQDAADESIIEWYHQEALSSGTRIREKLSQAVEKSLKTLGNGLLKHAANTSLREKISTQALKPQDYYLSLLRSVYRMLFLFVIEERNLIFPDERDEDLNRKRHIYYNFYSLQRLAKLVEKSIYVDPRKTDLWQSLKTTFQIFEFEKHANKFGLRALGAGIFSPNALEVFYDVHLDNKTLLAVLQNLVLFENERGTKSRVNYADLDVEEFGSVYEGLLEYEPQFTETHGQFAFGFVKGDGRSSSGSHYTPEELVKPLIKHSLDYIIADKLKEPDPEKALLSITVCDVACGSGHILLSAARRIGFELAIIRESKTQHSVVEQPSPPYLRQAIRDVIRHCIYGVDLNPLAVELCKVALWLEAHNPNEPLNFLDHHIKCGNAIVGLAHFKELQNGIATEAFKTLPGDEQDLAATYRKRNDQERKTAGQLSTYNLDDADQALQGVLKDFEDFETLPENTPEEIEAKAQAYKKLTTGKKWFRLKALADLQVAQFFIAKTLENKEKLTTDKQYRTYLNTNAQIIDRGASAALAEQKHFFHWFLEFPEVFKNVGPGRPKHSGGGFDCILGNPPFLGGQKLTGTFGHSFAQFIQFQYAPIGSVDLVTYFFRRIFQIIKEGGFQSLISTNTIAQGSAREGGLGFITKNSGVINHAVRSMKWPGLAAVEVALVTIKNGLHIENIVLDNRKVEFISTQLFDLEEEVTPFQLKINENKTSVGSLVNGKGFVFDEEIKNQLIKDDIKSETLIYPYLNGQDLNSTINKKPVRYTINACELELNELKTYKACFEYLSKTVFFERLKLKEKKLIDQWWKYERRRPELYNSISNLDYCIVIALTSKTVCFDFYPTNLVFSNAIVVIFKDDYLSFCQLQSSFHFLWVSKYTTPMKGDLRYLSSSCYETFPFISPSEIETKSKFEELGKLYFDFRLSLIRNIRQGLTMLYNQFHNYELTKEVDTLPTKEFQKKFGKETWNLYNHLEVKKEGDISYEEAVPLIFKLRELHKQMDEAVLAAYGWHEDSEKWGKAIKLRHDFYEVDYLPENDRVRYTIHPDARKEVLKRLLLLNHERFEEEVAQGLHKKKDVEKYYQQKGKPIPPGTQFSDQKTKTNKKQTNKSTTVKEPQANYGAQGELEL